MFARGNHSSLLQKFLNYGRKKAYNIGPRLCFGVLAFLFVLVCDETDSNLIVLFPRHNDNTYNDISYNDFNYNNHTSSPAIQLVNFLFTFYCYK